MRAWPTAALLPRALASSVRALVPGFIAAHRWEGAKGVEVEGRGVDLVQLGQFGFRLGALGQRVLERLVAEELLRLSRQQELRQPLRVLLVVRGLQDADRSRDHE